MRSAERDHFGDYLRNLLVDEIKGRKLLKTKRFKTAAQTCTIAEGEGPNLAHSLLVKGKAAREQKLASAGEAFPEMVAYSREVLSFVHDVLDIAASFSVQVFASATNRKSKA